MSFSAGSTIVRATSGSRSRINSVEPLISANSAVTLLRSPSTGCGPSIARTVVDDLGRSGIGDPGTSSVVHCPQNLNPVGFSKRQLGQTSASAAVHCPQNFIPSGLSKPHLEHRIFALTSRCREWLVASRRVMDHSVLLDLDGSRSPVSQHSAPHLSPWRDRDQRPLSV